MKQFYSNACSIRATLGKPFSRAAVPNLSDTRGQVHGRQFFHELEPDGRGIVSG